MAEVGGIILTVISTYRTCQTSVRFFGPPDTNTQCEELLCNKDCIIKNEENSKTFQLNPLTCKHSFLLAARPLGYLSNICGIIGMHEWGGNPKLWQRRNPANWT